MHGIPPSYLGDAVLYRGFVSLAVHSCEAARVVLIQDLDLAAILAGRAKDIEL